MNTKQKIEPINVLDYENVVVLTGAGISVASGLRPYRGPDGIWDDAQVRKFSEQDAFHRDKRGAWKFWGGMREKALSAKPNAAHEHLAALQEAHCAGNVSIITQNVDELHQRAGSKNVIELHGSLFRSLCSMKECHSQPFRDEDPYTGKIPNCNQCGSVLRPDVTLFGESLPVMAERCADLVLSPCDLFVAIGTSGLVAPAPRFVILAKKAGARTVLINLESFEGAEKLFDDVVLGRAEELLPGILVDGGY